MILKGITGHTSGEKDMMVRCERVEANPSVFVYRFYLIAYKSRARAFENIQSSRVPSLLVLLRFSPLSIHIVGQCTPNCLINE